jgi:cyanate lyase
MPPSWQRRGAAGRHAQLDSTALAIAAATTRMLMSVATPCAAALIGLSPREERMLNEVPHRGSPMPPSPPRVRAVAQRRSGVH